MKNALLHEIGLCSDMVAVSGKERRCREHIQARFNNTDYVLEVDNIGNLCLHKPFRACHERVLVFAHMDEIGFIVRKIREDGFILFERLGGVNTQILPGTRVVFDGDSGLIEGVIGVQAHHFMPVDNKFKVPPIVNQYIDIGAKDKEEVLNRGIDVGTVIALKAEFQVLEHDWIRGKSLDNRMAVAITEQLALSLEKEDTAADIIYCFPVMEEFNIRGLMPVVRKYKPQYAIGLDITPACDTPDLNYNDIALDQGPAITYMNFHGGGTLAGVLPNEDLLQKTLKQADVLNIHLQREVSPGVITENAFALFENEEGIKVLNLSIPTRYTHTPFETASMKDVMELYELLNALLKSELNG